MNARVSANARCSGILPPNVSCAMRYCSACLKSPVLHCRTWNLDHFADVTERMFAYLSSFAIAPEPVSDPSFRIDGQVSARRATQRRGASYSRMAGSPARSRCSGARHILESTDLRTTCRRLGLRFRARHTCTFLAYPPDRGSDTRRSSPRPQRVNRHSAAGSVLAPMSISRL